MRARLSPVLVLSAILLAACSGGGSTPPGPTPSPSGPTPSPTTTYGPNLILNPGADDGGAVTSGSSRPVVLPHWTTVGTPSPTGVMDAESYGDTGDLSTTDPGPSDRGVNYFSGNQAGDMAVATQTIDLGASAARIDTGTVDYDLSAWLGGFSDQNDNATLQVSFRNASSTEIGTRTVGPVLAVDRQNVSELLLREVTGAVPVGTRSAVLTLTMTRTDGTYNDGYADSLSFKISQ